MANNKLTYSLAITITTILVACGSPQRLGSGDAVNANAASSSPAVQPVASEMTSAESLVAAKNILSSDHPGDEIYDVRGALSRVPKEAAEYKEAYQLLAKLDAIILRRQEKREAPQRARSLAESQALREWLQEEYRKTVAEANPYLNFIKASITKTKHGYALWAVHSYFNRYSFKAGDDAHVVKQWIDKHREQLSKAEIHRVGLMDEDTSGGSCWYDL